MAASRDDGAGNNAAALPPSTTPALDPRGTPVLAICIACGADLSKVALGGVFPGPDGPTVVILTPLRCTECGEPMMWRATVLRPPGRRG